MPKGIMGTLAISVLQDRHQLVIHMGDCQNYGPFLGPYYNTAPNTGPN